MIITKHTIDAKGKKLGRVASEAAIYLLGKKEVGFAPNTVADMKVTIINASEVRISEKKKKETTYKTYSGYPGGLKINTMEHMIGNKGYAEVFKTAISGMLPNNKLKKEIMKNLTISE
jgi:large subunit ribosomal protein L13